MKKMADISKEVQDFKTAIYGEDVRDSMVSLAEKINNEVENNTQKVTQYGQAEASRAQAETGRVQAEQQRVQEFSTLKTASENATSAANSAAGVANSAASNANSKASLANTAAGNADTAASAANSAASAANTATGKANKAIEDAESAAENAATAAGDANSAASVANTAADRANEAAEKAEGVIINNISAFSVTFQQAAERANIQSGDTLAVAFGKLAKFFSDMQNVAFSGSYNDLKNKPTSMTANGGNADTVNGKHAADLQNYNNLTNKPSLGAAASQSVANNLTTNAAGSVLDARQGRALDQKISSLGSALNGKIVFKAGNVKFTDGGGGKSYGYIEIPADCEMLAVYMQEVSGNVGLMLKGFNKNAGSGGYTIWADFTINDNVYLHWIYAKVS